MSEVRLRGSWRHDDDRSPRLSPEAEIWIRAAAANLSSDSGKSCVNAATDVGDLMVLKARERGYIP